MSHNQVPQHFPASDVVFLDAGNGTSALIHLHGATVLSWKVNGKEMLFVSEKSVFDGKKAIRGGIPIVFPQFGPWASGPQHGFCRIKRWNSEIPPTKDSKGTVIAMLSLQDDEETRQMWNYKFKVVYSLRLQENAFIMNLTIHNEGMCISFFGFSTLLHSYIRTPDILNTSVHGLNGVKYVDKVNNNRTDVEKRENIFMDENYDRVYIACPTHVDVSHIGCGQHNLNIKTFNLPDIVLWNPWTEKAKAMSDFGDEEYKNMICVEGGKVNKPVTLEAGKQFECSQTFTVSPAY
ncbi:hypothetical protein LOTGIDRAFT_111836 [Lottia gigantea]|uniref:glucose-6-phosphate 1-epimerase n=1 Tax=Lottia gigantea TaxID=225164 RepID=V4B5E7_LOTGI|nr:hypothetical protein LOTGIDRAFT_111836 [Lottia gigantea]ESP01222.1 hypothetical protein LOTGIDRAFT_111836 [Lottia gigantea]